MEALNRLSINREESQHNVAGNDMEGNILFAEDEILLLKIFPIEVWELVAKYLTDCENQILSNVSPFFRKLLFEQRKLFLFRKSLEHLAPYLVRSDGEEGTGSTFLDCRVVCQTWNQAVDWYFADDKTAKIITQYITNDMEKRAVNNAHRKEFSNVNDGGQKLAKFLHQFQIQPASSTMRNPFIGRTVYINYREQLDLYYNCMNDITTLFNRYGEQIHSLTIDCRNFTRKSYSALALWLGKVGKVQFLKMICDSVSGNQKNLDRILICSVPKFQHLNTLVFDNLPISLVKNLIWKNTQTLATLIMRQKMPPSEDGRLMLPSFPTLKEFSGPIPSRDQMLYISGCFSKSDIQTLSLYCCPEFGIFNRVVNPDAASLDFFEILKLIADKWGKTLKRLSLILPIETTSDRKQKYLRESANLRLNLPHLETIRLEVKSRIHLAFLLGAKNTLRRVQINTDDESSLSDQKVLGGGSSAEITVQFLGYENRMHESNIWTVFPELSDVEICLNYEWHKFQRSDLAPHNNI